MERKGGGGNSERKKASKSRKIFECSYMLTHGCIACSNCLWKPSLISARKPISSLCAMFPIEESSEFILNPDQMGDEIHRATSNEWRLSLEMNYKLNGGGGGKRPLKMNKQTNMLCALWVVAHTCCTMCTFSTICTHPVQGFKPRTKTKTATRSPTASNSNNNTKERIESLLQNGIGVVSCGAHTDLITFRRVQLKRTVGWKLFSRSIHGCERECVCVCVKSYIFNKNNSSAANRIR